MTRKGGTSRDFRSEAERIHQRPKKSEFDQEYERAGRAPERVQGHRSVRYGPEDQKEYSDRALFPDNVMREEIVGLLSQEPHITATDITVEVQDGVALLTGSVDTINTKYQSEEIARRVKGMSRVENHLKVCVGESLDEFTRGAAASRLHDELTRGLGGKLK